MIAQRDAGGSFRAIAKALNESKQFTSRGSAWSAMAVKRVLDRVRSEE